MTDRVDAPIEAEHDDSPPAKREQSFSQRNAGKARIVAMAAGALGILLALLSPFLPVDYTKSELVWPQQGSIANVAAPNVSFVPVSMEVSVPCALGASLPRNGGVLLSTVPEGGAEAGKVGLFIRATADNLQVVQRNVVLLNTPRAPAQNSPDCRIVVVADTDGSRGSIQGVPETDGSIHEFDLKDPNARPQIIGVYSGLPSNVSTEGLSFRSTIDTRFVSTPTTLKFWLLVLGVASTILSLAALAVLDARDARGHHKIFPAGWWRVRPVDGFVALVLGIWLFVGGNTADDGYQVTVGRIAREAGYLDNYYRYFGVPQDPFGWHYQYLSVWMDISTATPWLRLLPFMFAMASWWLISRAAIPRLGRAVRESTPAVWAAALVFLAVWMPYNNGLRVEPLIALGTLFTWVCVERAIATGRFLPLTVAIISAAFTLTIHPTGVIAAIALVAGIRPLLKRFMVRRKRDGALPLLLPILAAGLAVMFEIFADQPLAPILEAVSVNGQVGPTNKWWEEPMRYYMLMNPTADGGIARRFGVLIVFTCFILVVIMLLNRRRLPGIATAPTWRLLAMVAGSVVLMAFLPTKWTHQMGVYAAIGGALAAVATACADRTIMRRRRNRTLFAAACAYVLALAFSGRNQWWYVGSYGIPWRDAVPDVKGIPLWTGILAVAVALTLLGLWQHFRDDYVDEAARAGSKTLFSRLRSPSIIIVSAIMLMFTLVSFAKADWTQRNSWSWLSSNVNALKGEPCALADAVLVENDPTAGLLAPARVAGQNNPSPGAALAGAGLVGFDPNGVASDLSEDTEEESDDSAGTSTAEVDRTQTDPTEDGSSSDDTTTSSTTDTSGGRTAQAGVNGSTVKLPFGLSPSKTPVLGTYNSPTGTGSLTSDWYQLPDGRSDAQPLITMSVAGYVEYIDDLAVVRPGQKVRLQFGRVAPDGTVAPAGQMIPLDIGGAPEWRNLRFPLDQAPPGATVVRVLAEDTSPLRDQWLAVTPPRVSSMETLNKLVGSEEPVLIDWEAGLAFPCQRPAQVKNGVLETPVWRISPDREGERVNSQRWMSGDAGGPLGIIENELRGRVYPSYLRNDWAKDWGSLQGLTPILPQKDAELIVTTETHNGLWTPGPMRAIGN
ncbi:arabinosyltransferase domain-containing protein [Gordonia rubripertincta]|uniref:Arabinosyltransferase domain-containing protein n=2 Tax=Gordonia rubripertincta TaxID=36822 RepID=A0AAW6R9C0_GORRU|nr:arabinosyltransferase domain-containing protein [Gordonia rubripertincta]MDG6780735.1 arabinosyltransferase domain-containing protein [Gordonia rubripertincta]NKY63175.1 arabinosyltransferase [Gordonia rubripertincta]GAB86348.1 putative arabinosyltransferase [Gordonia rubripertincta NBRC 101908]